MPEISYQQSTVQEQFWVRVARRVEPAIAHFLTNDLLFDELDQGEMVSRFSRLLVKKFSPVEFEALTDEDLRRRTRRFLGVEVMSGLVSDFTPEEMAEFDAAVSGQRWR